MLLRRLQIRCLSTTNARDGVNRVMNKVLGGSQQKHKRFKYVDTPMVSTTNSVTSVTHDGKRSVNTKRINILNKLFMRHITDLMATGTYSHVFTGHGIEVNRVKVTPDFKQVQVYWLSNTDQLLENIDDVLKDHAGHLRHELSQLRVMGVVPRIVFVKDMQNTILKLLDDRLAQADFGEDHQPADTASRLKLELSLQAPLEARIKQRIKTLESEEPEEAQLTQTADEEDWDIPPMPQDVLGLNHAVIFERVLNACKKTPRVQSQPLSSGGVNNTPVEYASQREQREAFRAFLDRRQLQRAKGTRVDKTYRPEWDYLDAEGEEQQERRLEKFEFKEWLVDADDYIDDDHENSRFGQQK